MIMMLRGNACLFACCVSVLVVLTVAGRKGRSAEGGCNSVLAISSETQSNSVGNGNLHSRSLSPWTWKPATVENRIPSTVWEAECTTSYCSYPSPRHDEGPRYNAVPIHQQVLVLTRKGKERCYTASYLSLAVGCTCVLAKTA